MKLFAAVLMFTALAFAQAPTTANLWVDSNGGTCTRQSTAGAYSDAGACSTIDAAWDAASVGDVIVIKAGTYGSQTITGNKTTPGATVWGEATTEIGALSVSANFFNMNEVTVDIGDSAHNTGGTFSGNNITLTDVNFEGLYFAIYITGDDFTWMRGNFGVPGQSPAQRVCGTDGEPITINGADRPTIDGMHFYAQGADETPSGCSADGFHLEAIRVDLGGSDFTLRNSTFYDGDESSTATVFVTNSSSGQTYSGLKFENNRFGPNNASSGALSVHTNVASCPNWTFAYNTYRAYPGAFVSGGTGCASSTSGWLWVGNIGPYASSSPCAGTHTKNVWQYSISGSCGSDTWVIGTAFSTDALGFTGTDGFDLSSSSPGKDAAETPGASDYCTGDLNSVDYRGFTRPFNSICDAGAYEYGASGGGGSSAPTVTTSAASSVTSSSATGNGNVTSDGGETITERGFCWATTSNPTTGGTCVTSAGTAGSYTGSMTSLSASTLYHYRAYAINSVGTSYGSDTTFTTSGVGPQTWYVSTTGSDSNSCTSSGSPCLTINGAYQKASGGDTIEIAAGSYGDQTIERNASISSTVTIQPAAAASIDIEDVTIEGSFITLTGPMTLRTLDLGDSTYTNRTTDLLIDNITIDHEASASPDWRAMKVWATDDVTIQNSTIGNTLSGASLGEDSNLIQFGGATNSTNFTIDGVRFHHNDTQMPTGAHNECIYAINIQGFTVRRSRFESCTYYGIFFTDFLNGQPSLSDVLIENNYFATGQNDSGADYPYAIDIHPNVSPDNFTFQYNTFENWVAFSFGGSVTNGFVAKGNIFGLGTVADSAVGTPACKSGVTFSYNVSPNSCGSNATVATSTDIRNGWTSPSSTWGTQDNFTLLDSSPAVGAGDPASYPSTDFSSNNRPLGVIDAGASEIGAENPTSSLGGTVSIGGKAALK